MEGKSAGEKRKKSRRRRRERNTTRERYTSEKVARIRAKEDG
jgi:hypothetical protein